PRATSRVGALVPQAIGPLLLVPGDDRPSRLCRDLADAEPQRELGVEEMSEDLGGRPLAARRATPQPSAGGPADHAPEGARRRRQRVQDVAATETVMGDSAHRARHLATSSSCVLPYNSAP